MPLSIVSRIILSHVRDYKLNREGVCHRIQVAVRIETLSDDQWREFVRTGKTVVVDDEDRADKFLCENILLPYHTETELALGHLRAIGDDKITSVIRRVLLMRWEQIQDLIRSAFSNGLNHSTQVQYHMFFDAPEQ